MEVDKSSDREWSSRDSKGPFDQSRRVRRHLQKREVVCVVWFFFFFQAEDGIRDLTVTGVQTCALPICGFFLTLRRACDRWRNWALTWQLFRLVTWSIRRVSPERRCGESAGSKRASFGDRKSVGRERV